MIPFISVKKNENFIQLRVENAKNGTLSQTFSVELLLAQFSGKMEIFCQFNLFYTIFMQNIEKTKHILKSQDFRKNHFPLTVMLRNG